MHMVNFANGKPYGILVNLADTDDHLSHHWLAFYVNARREATYFETTGYGVLNRMFDRFIRTNYTKTEGNVRRIQKHLSPLAAMYAAYFLYYMNSGGTLKGFLKKFTKSHLEVNDLLIQYYQERTVLKLKRYKSETLKLKWKDMLKKMCFTKTVL